MWSRRLFLRAGALTLFSAGTGPLFLDRMARAAAPDGRPKVLVTIFLRGAMDGLMAVPPIADPELRRARPRLAMSAARGGGVADLDGRFGLHPALSPLLPYWNDGRLAIVHGVGSPNPTRSHFDAQDFLESGTPFRKSTSSGWLNRVAGVLGHDARPFRAVSLTDQLPRSLAGEAPALAVGDLAELDLPLTRDAHLAERLDVLFGDPHDDLAARSREMRDALALVSQAELASYRHERGAAYPHSPLGQSLLQIAFLVRAGVGLQIAFAESDGWDTHVGQGTDGGPFARRATDLSTALAAFWEDLGPYQDDVVVVTMTEFGRTVAENGSAGTDHGYGSCLFTLGNSVDGGRVYGQIPELSPDALFEGRDLPVTTDFRAVLAEVAGKLFRIRDDRAVFPGWHGQRLPLLW